jgi:hypothetical protein
MKIPKKCSKIFEMIKNGEVCITENVDEAIDCLARKMGDNDGKSRIGAKYRREAEERLGRLCSGEIEKIELEYASVSSPKSKIPEWMTPDKYDEFLEMLAILNKSPLFGTEEKEEKELTADDFLDLVEGDG